MLMHALITSAVATAITFVSASVAFSGQEKSFNAFRGVTIDNARTTLGDAGYQNLRMVRGNPSRWTARDSEGSRVIIKVNHQSGLIELSEYVHFLDR